MSQFKFHVGDFVVFDKSSKYDSDDKIKRLHGRYFQIQRRWRINDNENEYTLESFRIEEEALSLVLSFKNIPDYQEEDVVTIVDSEFHKDWNGKQCEIMKVSKRFGKPRDIQIRYNRCSVWMYPCEISYLMIEPVTEDEVMDLLE